MVGETNIGETRKSRKREEGTRSLRTRSNPPRSASVFSIRFKITNTRLYSSPGMNFFILN